MPAHPGGAASGDTHHQGVFRHILGHDGAGGNKRISANGRAAHDGRVGADRGAFADDRLLVHVPAHDFAARIDDVGQNAGRPEEDVVLDDGAGVEGNVVLDLDVVADLDMARHQDVLPKVAAGADFGVRHDVAKVPDLRAFADFTGDVNVGGWVDVVVGFHADLSSMTGGWMWHGDTMPRCTNQREVEHGEW